MDMGYLAATPRYDSLSQRHATRIFNPFRQEDEDKVLAKRSHNRRRWSHVFPQGEIEFKRHSGPIWKSLTSPAILPLSVDFFPSRQEIDQFFQFNIYNVTLSDFENTPYSTHADLLMEMVRQRLSQDYQLVPPSCVDQTIRRPKPVIDHGKLAAGYFCQKKIFCNLFIPSCSAVWIQRTSFKCYSRFAFREEPKCSDHQAFLDNGTSVSVKSIHRRSMTILMC